MLEIRTYHRLALLVAAIAIVLPAASAVAQPTANFSLSVGGFPTSFSTSARLDPEGSDGTEVDLENDLGLDSNLTNVRVEATWRFRPRHRFEAGYTSWRRTGGKSIEKPIQWGDTLYDLGASLDVTNNARFIKLAYRYSLFNNGRTEFDVGAGIDTVWSKTTLEGEGTITDPTGHQVQGRFEETYDYVAPAPVLGMSIGHLATPKVFLRGSVEYFQATFDQTTGKVLDVRGSADYLFSPNWGAGAGYTWVGYKVERDRFDANYDFSGPIIYLSYRR